MDKTLKIVIILVCVLCVLLVIVGWVFLSFLLSLPDTRGLQVSPTFVRTNDAKFPSVENTGKETACISRFHDENNDTIKASHEFWNGWFYELPSGKYISLTMDGQQFYSHEIYVEFTDGYECKLGKFN